MQTWWFILIFFSCAAYSQDFMRKMPKGVNHSLSATLDYSNRIFEGYNDYAERYLINESFYFRTYVWGYSFSYYMIKPVTRDLSITQGIAFSKRGEHTPVFKGWIPGNPYLREADTAEFSPMNFGVSYNYEYYFIELPFTMKYNFGREDRTRFFINGGFSPDLLFRTKTAIYLHNYRNLDTRNVETQSKYKMDLFYLHGIFGTGLDIRVGRYSSLNVGPEANYYFISPQSKKLMVSETQMGKLFSVGMKMGVAF